MAKYSKLMTYHITCGEEQSVARHPGLLPPKSNKETVVVIKVTKTPSVFSDFLHPGMNRARARRE